MNIQCSTWMHGGFQERFTALQTCGLSPKRVKFVTKITYSSAIAHRLAAQCQLPVAAIAVDVTNVLHQLLQEQKLDSLNHLLPLPLPTQAFQYLQVQATPTGLIQIDWTDAAIAQWLDFLIQPCSDLPATLTAQSETLPDEKALIKQPPEPALDHPSSFALQHAHARCCSLLRLAHHQGMIALNRPTDHPVLWQFLQPRAVPWLTASAQLQLTDAVDRSLISHLLTAFEASLSPLSQSSQNLILRVAAELSQAFDQCHRRHQLWATRQNSEGTIAYLGLLLATQRVLQQFLVMRLHIYAPSQL